MDESYIIERVQKVKRIYRGIQRPGKFGEPENFTEFENEARNFEKS